MNTQDDDDRALRDQAKDWVLQLTTGAATQHDLRALAEWRAISSAHEIAFAEACRLWQALGTPLAVAAGQPQADPMPARHWRPIGRRAFLGGAAAASVAVIAGTAVRPPLGLWPSVMELAADHHTGIGEQRRIELADKASIEMNTRTSLNIRNVADADIELWAGEAAVTLGPQRVVLAAAGGRTTGSGAEFIIRCDGSSVRITCLHGRVYVAHAGQSAELSAPDQLTYDPAGLGPPRAVDPQAAAGWRGGVLVFDNERVSDVVDEVNRYRHGRIVLTNTSLGARRVTARVRLSRLDAILAQLQDGLGAKVTQLAGGFVLLS
jgi:transmembrane sensor